jgi:hypothetical protein
MKLAKCLVSRQRGIELLVQLLFCMVLCRRLNKSFVETASLFNYVKRIKYNYHDKSENPSQMAGEGRGGGTKPAN